VRQTFRFYIFCEFKRRDFTLNKGAPAAVCPEFRLARAMAGKNFFMALAESCTGGLISHLITEVPGSSAYFDRSLVVYSNKAKSELLGVPEKIFQTDGAVSKACAAAMLEGLFERTAADLAAAVTGIAGPTGGSEEKPVGAVWIACGWRGSINCELFVFSGERSQVKRQAAEVVLNRLAELAEQRQ